MSTVLLGPIGNLGYPFSEHNHDAIRQQEIGSHLVYSFAKPYIYSDYDFVPAEPLDAVIAWDPGWYQNGKAEQARNECAKLKNVAIQHKVPLIGMYCDWFASWDPDMTVGVPHSVPYMDGFITDPCGAAAMRTLKLLSEPEPGDLQYRPIIELDTYLSYGRLASLADDRDAVWGVQENYPQASRTLDVCFIGYPHPASVITRSWYLEALIEICERKNYSYKVAYGVSKEKMEEMLLTTKVCFNTSVGSSLNMRVYEAAAAGCVLLTDAHNLQNNKIRWAPTYRNKKEIEQWLEVLLTRDDSAEYRQRVQVDALTFALQNDPIATWHRIINAAMMAKGKMGDSWEKRPESVTMPAVTKSDVRKLKQSTVELI